MKTDLVAGTPPRSPVARLQFIVELASPQPIHDEHGDTVGYGPPIIDAATAIRLLDASE